MAWSSSVGWFQYVDGASLNDSGYYAPLNPLPWPWNEADAAVSWYVTAASPDLGLAYESKSESYHSRHTGTQEYRLDRRHAPVGFLCELTLDISARALGAARSVRRVTLCLPLAGRH